MQLLSYVRENGCWIVEDDYDSEFRYEGRSISSLQGLDRHDRVIYTGTFSKALLPGLRIGYMVVPPDLISVFRSVRPALDRCPASLQQRIVADFLLEGHYPGHLRRLRENLRASRDLLVDYLGRRMRDYVEVKVPNQGVNLIVTSIISWNCDIEIYHEAKSEGVVVMPFSHMNINPIKRSSLLLGFSGLSEQETDLGTKLLTKTFERVVKRKSSPGRM